MTLTTAEIKTAIRELSGARGVSPQRGQDDDAAEIERRIDGYREDPAGGPGVRFPRKHFL